MPDLLKNFENSTAYLKLKMISKNKALDLNVLMVL